MNEDIQLLNAIMTWAKEHGIDVGSRAGGEVYMYWNDRIFKITVRETQGIPQKTQTQESQS